MFVKTYRLPTPLLIFQAALVVGAFGVGILLSPFLVLARHTAQRPVRRLKHPAKRDEQRRYLALGFYIGSFLIIFGMIGMWTRWCLGKRDPWLWVIFWITEGQRTWTRPALLCYWALLGIISVIVWNLKLTKWRRYKAAWSSTNDAPAASNRSSGSFDQSGGRQDRAPTPPVGNLGFAGGSQMANDLFDAANKHVPTLSLNARRKSFHALAVAMFVPGVALDVSHRVGSNMFTANSLHPSSLRLFIWRSAQRSRFSPSQSIFDTLRFIPLERRSICL